MSASDKQQRFDREQAINNPTPQYLSLWQRTTTGRFLKWLFRWQTARRILVTIAVIVTLIGALYAEEDFRGRRAWNRYRQEAKARGEELDWKALIPKPVPDDQNFAAIPLVKSWFVRSTNTFRSNQKGDYYEQAFDRVGAADGHHDLGSRRFLDLVAWSNELDVVRNGKVTSPQKFASDKLDLASRAQAAPSVLDALKTNEVEFAELHAAGQRPYSRYPVDYDVANPAAISLPHLMRVRGYCRRLQLKACAELALGQSEKAFDDIKLSFSVADSVKGEPILISYLVRVACLQITAQPIWEGLASHSWSDAQLRELQTRLQQYDFVADLKLTFDAERDFCIGLIKYVKRTGNYAELLDTDDDGRSPLVRLARIVPVPGGWFDQEQANYARLFASEMEGTFDPAARRIFPNRSKASEQMFDREFHGRSTMDLIFIRHQWMSSMLLLALNRVVVKAATAQVVDDQAVLACALERYRLANGRFPETLDALAPGFISQLPHDVLTGELYKYRLTKDGQFVLYSVGWNEKDDGGVPGKTLFDEKEGDWVWQYPPAQ